MGMVEAYSSNSPGILWGQSRLGHAFVNGPNPTRLFGVGARLEGLGAGTAQATHAYVPRG